MGAKSTVSQPQKTKKALLKIGFHKRLKYWHIYLPTENDDYVKCAGDAVKKCMVEDVEVFDSDKEVSDSEDYVYIECMTKEAETCPADILHHAVEQLEAYKRHLKRLGELEELEGQ